MKNLRFESSQDLTREQEAITHFLTLKPKCSYVKLGENQVDFKILDQDKIPVAYVEVKGRNGTMKDAYPLPVSAYKVVKLCKLRLNPIIIWSCLDGIIYGQVTKIVGEAKWGGRKQRGNWYADQELMIYYDKQNGLKEMPF